MFYFLKQKTKKNQKKENKRLKISLARKYIAVDILCIVNAVLVGRDWENKDKLLQLKKELWCFLKVPSSWLFKLQAAGGSNHSQTGEGL